MTEQSIGNKQAIKNFQQKSRDRSILDLVCFDGLADYLLQCCSAQAKANTLSFFSLLPILILSLIISGPSRLWFALTAVSLLLHQILDIANKKQAYRLQTFSFGTYYFDHICDSLSCLLIVYIFGTLFQLQNNWLWLSIFIFGMLPFYIHHLTMYYTEYMCFPAISPVSEGLVVLEILCFVGLISPTIFTLKIANHQWFNGSHIVMCFALLWMLVFVLLDLRDIVKSSAKFNQTFALKNLFVIFVIGYVVFESAVIEPNIINNSSQIFGLFFYTMICTFTMMIGQLILKYASNQKFQQISANTLAVTTFLVLFYAICALGNLNADVQNKLGSIGAVLLAIGESVYCILRTRKIMRFITDAVNG